MANQARYSILSAGIRSGLTISKLTSCVDLNDETLAKLQKVEAKLKEDGNAKPTIADAWTKLTFGEADHIEESLMGIFNGALNANKAGVAEARKQRAEERAKKDAEIKAAKEKEEAEKKAKGGDPADSKAPAGN